MKVTFKKVAEENFLECVGLKVREDQPFVASNMFSLAEAKACPWWIVRSVYDGATMVGFIMYVLDREEGELYLCRLMVDARFQGRGYGTAILGKLAALARKAGGIRRIRLSTDPKNEAGIRFYAKYGFVDTGTMDEGEEVFVLDLA